MPEAVNPEKIVEAVAVADLKAVAEQPAILANLALGNAVSNQQAMNQIMQATVGKIVEAIVMTSPSEAGGAVAALQQLLKGAQTTPPVT